MCEGQYVMDILQEIDRRMEKINEIRPFEGLYFAADKSVFQNRNNLFFQCSGGE